MAVIYWSCSFAMLLTINIMIMIPKSTLAATFFRSYCSNSSTYGANSSFPSNLNIILDSLSSNSATNPTGFHTTSAGSGTDDAVYGLYLCRWDQGITGCNDCVTTAKDAQSSKINCPNTKSGILWYDQCMVKYDSQPVARTLDQSVTCSLLNPRNISGDQQAFADLLSKTLKELAAQAASSPGDQIGKKYANKIVGFDNSSRNLYSTVQCTPDLSAGDCSKCLAGVISQLKDISRQGGRLYQPSCYVWYELYPFLLTDTFNWITSTSPIGKSKVRTSLFIISLPTIAAAMLTLLCFGTWICLRKRKAMERYDVDIEAESLQYDLKIIKTSTNNFSPRNKLGEGGFGEVYKGKLESGQEVAIKRLSKTSGQGVAEFRTEVVLVAKLQHKNLVKLLGFCMTSKEKILVYEYLHNSSLDKFLFGSTENVGLDWQTRINIMVGIARGLLYLHEDSRLKVIHRDLKTSNILLDETMNPKISDFGLARTFGVDQTQGDTNKVVGTYGYMAPEYAITGHYSEKSDVYSFGIIMLEIVSGQKNRVTGLVQLEEALLLRAWRLWNEAKPLDLVDPKLSNNVLTEEVLKCIHIGLLCVQEDATKRPRMTSVVAALSGQIVDLPMPKPPHFVSWASNIKNHHTLDEHTSPYTYTGRETITELYPRE